MGRKRIGMKIIHCADIHLDSALNTHLSFKQAQMRRNEILLTFLAMVKYARQEGARAIMIAGDLFDTGEVSLKTANVIKECIQEYQDIDFIYLAGNHDEAVVTERIPGVEKLKNLRLFFGDGAAYRYGNVVITGLNRTNLQQRIQLKPEDINIVMMHGQITNLNDYAGKNIDYIAMGHIHSNSCSRIDARGVHCYCGCLEARGFDECGTKGFILLETGESQGVEKKFVPFAKRTAHEINVDISEAVSTPQICSLIEDKLVAINHKDLVKIILTGSCDANLEMDTEYIKQLFSEEFFAFHLENQTELFRDISEFEQEISLRGEFVRLVMAGTMEESKKRDMIEYGIRALSGKRLG
jgi:DNA repair exonuclease SbcCD nuclease subunit